MTRKQPLGVAVLDVLTALPVFATAPLYRRWHLRWGATDAEVRSSMPGDELVPKYAVFQSQCRNQASTPEQAVIHLRHESALGGTRPERQASSAPRRALGRRSALVAIKLVHSAIFLVNSAAILHIFVAGLRDRPSRWTKPALAEALAESAVFVANRGRCPLTDLAERLGAESGRVSDIFLPRWCADRIPQLCTPPLLVGVLTLAVNTWRHAAHQHVSNRSARSHDQDLARRLWQVSERLTGVRHRMLDAHAMDASIR